MKTYIAALAAFLFFASSACHAQLGGAAPPPEVKKVDGPSLEDTTKWISEKLPAVTTTFCSPTANEDYRCSAQVRFDGCTATLIHRTTYTTHPEHPGSYDVYIFPLADVEVKAVTQPDVEMKTRTLVNRPKLSIDGLGYRKVMRHYGGKGQLCTDKPTGPTCWGEYLTSGITDYPYFESFEMADRMATAFHHAQQLCRQRAAEEKTKKIQEEAARNAKKPGDLF